MANYSQRYSNAQTNTAGAFKFDTITSVDWPVAKLIWGDEGTATYASASNPLPVTISGVSTAANQSTANGLLTTIDADTGAIATSAASLDSKTPALGQALAAASVPVVLTAAQLSTLTPPAAITGFATLAEQQTQSTSLTTIIGHVNGLEGSLADAVTALQIMDDWDETNRCAVNLIVGQAGVAAGAGAVNTTTQRVTLASDDPGVTHLNTLAARAQTGAVNSSPMLTVGGYSSDLAGYCELTLDDVGALRVNVINAELPVVASGTVNVKGDIAHDQADSNAPLKIGARATTSLAGFTPVSSGDRTDCFADSDGVLLVRPHASLGDLVSGVASITDGSSTSVIAAQGAGVKTYITAITVANTSATPVTVDIRDGAAGTVKWTLPVPADTLGVTMTFPTPLGFSANTAVCADPSAAASTVTVSLSGFKSKV